MARRLFFVPAVRNDRAELRGDDARHLTRVLRVEQGQRYEISDNHARYLGEVEAARKDLVTFRIIEKLAFEEPSLRITMAVALIKFDRLEWILEKATELGVTTIVPVETARSERGLERAAGKRIERWRRIVLESSQQSRRSSLPEVADARRFSDVLALPAPLRLFLDENPGTPPLGDALTEPAASEIALLVGPEGGWTDDERVAATAAGWRAISLGPQVLRTETAAIAALAIVTHRLQ